LTVCIWGFARVFSTLEKYNKKAAQVNELVFLIEDEDVIK